METNIDTAKLIPEALTNQDNALDAALKWALCETDRFVASPDEKLDYLLSAHYLGRSQIADLRILESREAAGFDFHQVATECRRVWRYLAPDDDGPHAVDDIAQLIGPLGLVWDGAYEIEAWRGENECQRRSKIRPKGGAKPGHVRRTHETSGRAQPERGSHACASMF